MLQYGVIPSGAFDVPVLFSELLGKSDCPYPFQWLKGYTEMARVLTL